MACTSPRPRTSSFLWTLQHSPSIPRIKWVQEFLFCSSVSAESSSSGCVGNIGFRLCCLWVFYHNISFYGNVFSSHDLKVTCTVGSLVCTSCDQEYIRTATFP